MRGTCRDRNKKKGKGSPRDCTVDTLFLSLSPLSLSLSVSSISFKSRGQIPKKRGRRKAERVSVLIALESEFEEEETEKREGQREREKERKKWKAPENTKTCCAVIKATWFIIHFRRFPSFSSSISLLFCNSLTFSLSSYFFQENVFSLCFSPFVHLTSRHTHQAFLTQTFLMLTIHPHASSSSSLLLFFFSSPFFLSVFLRRRKLDGTNMEAARKREWWRRGEKVGIHVDGMRGRREGSVTVQLEVWKEEESFDVSSLQVRAKSFIISWTKEANFDSRPRERKLQRIFFGFSLPQILSLPFLFSFSLILSLSLS